MTFELKFGDPESIERARRRGEKPPKIDKMYGIYGFGPEAAVCRDCVQMTFTGNVRAYPKCRLFGVTHGTGTDWKKLWRACGKFEQKPCP